MTVINGFEIDNITYRPNLVKQAILNNDKIEGYLHCIIVVSNPCLYARRYILAREFIDRFQREDQCVKLYVVELTYPGQEYMVTEKNNPRHLQLKTVFPLWHKENMINLGVQYLLPVNWKAMAWIDADIEFESTTWASDALKVLNGTFDVVQLFSHCVDMDKKQKCMQNFTSAGYQYIKNNMNYQANVGLDFYHPGFAWAMTRKTFDKMGGLYEYSILGSGDNNMLHCWLGGGLQSINPNTTQGYKDSISELQEFSMNTRLGYVPGVIRHHFHGAKINRKYSERWKILVNHQFDPFEHLAIDKIGVLSPSTKCPKQLLDDILTYFKERNEDDE